MLPSIVNFNLVENKKIWQKYLQEGLEFPIKSSRTTQKTKAVKNICLQEMFMLLLHVTFNPVLVFTGFRTSGTDYYLTWACNPFKN